MKIMKQEIKQLLKSDLTNYEIWKGSGVSSSKISDLRHEKAKINNISLRNAERLYQYYQVKFEDEIQEEKESFGYYSAIAQILTFMIEFDNNTIDSYIIEFELSRKLLLKYLDYQDIEIIDNNAVHFNDKAKIQWER